MLVTLMLWQLGCISTPYFYISRFFEEHKAEYIHHMREVSSSGAWEGWCVFFLGAVKEQVFRAICGQKNFLTTCSCRKTQTAQRALFDTRGDDLCKDEQSSPARISRKFF